MFFFKIAGLFRAAQAALIQKDYLGVVGLAADLLDALDMTSLAEHVRGELAALGTGDARGIAENALGAVADLVNAAFTFDRPLTVSAAPPGPNADALVAKCEQAIARCEQATAPKATAAGPEAKITPDQVISLIALLAPIVERLFAAIRDRRNK